MSYSPLIQCIYASTSGNVEAVVEHMAQLCAEGGLNVSLHRAEQTPKEIVAANTAFIFATSTWEHGALNPFFQKLLTEMSQLNCKDKQASFIGLGDRRYEPVLFCEGVERVKRVWKQQCGSEVGETLKINGEPYRILDTVVTEWTQQRIADWVKILTTGADNNNAPLDTTFLPYV